MSTIDIIVVRLDIVSWLGVHCIHSCTITVDDVTPSSGLRVHMVALDLAGIRERNDLTFDIILTLFYVLVYVLYYDRIG